MQREKEVEGDAFNVDLKKEKAKPAEQETPASL